jgi:hypothetical protein
MKRETWRILALIGIGFFLHDAIWHALLVTIGMNGCVAMARADDDTQIGGDRNDYQSIR